MEIPFHPVFTRTALSFISVSHQLLNMLKWNLTALIKVEWVRGRNTNIVYFLARPYKSGAPSLMIPTVDLRKPRNQVNMPLMCSLRQSCWPAVGEWDGWTELNVPGTRHAWLFSNASSAYVTCSQHTSLWSHFLGTLTCACTAGLMNIKTKHLRVL